MENTVSSVLNVSANHSEYLLSLNYSLPSMVTVAVVLFVVTVSTAFGNFLVGLSLFKFKPLRTVSNYLIGNLALSDFLLATTILPFSTVQECLGYWVFGEVMCNIWLMADVLYCTASIWNLMVIALDRFTATLYPLWYREKRGNRQAVIYIAVVWVVSALICMPPLLGWNDSSLNYRLDNATSLYQCQPFQGPGYVLYSAAGSFFIPCLITIFLYIRIFQVLRTRMKAMRKNRRQARLPLQTVEAGSSRGGTDSPDDDTDEHAAHTRSDHPLYTCSSSEVEARNGARPKMLEARGYGPSERPRRFFSNLLQTHKKREQPAVASNTGLSRRRYDAREMRATIRMAIIIGVFCGCWFGFFTVYVLRSWCSSCYIPRILDAFFFWLGYANSSMNPILYAIFNEEFRRAFQKLLGCYRQGNKPGQPLRR